MNVSAVLKRALLGTVAVAAAIVVIGGVLAGALVGVEGVISVLIGVALAVVFAGLTVVSLLVGSRLELNGFFATVLGTWLAKAIVFIVVLWLLRGAEFVHPLSLFLSVVAAVVGTLAVDVVVVLKSRMTYASDVSLPGDGAPRRD